MAVHLAQGVGEQFQARAVGIAQVERRAALLLVRHAGRVELAAQALPRGPVDRDRQVVQPADAGGCDEIRLALTRLSPSQAESVARALRALPDVESVAVEPA